MDLNLTMLFFSLLMDWNIVIGVLQAFVSMFQEIYNLEPIILNSNSQSQPIDFLFNFK